MQENTALFEFDAQIAAQGYPLVCGVDEAGRGGSSCSSRSVRLP